MIDLIQGISISISAIIVLFSILFLIFDIIFRVFKCKKALESIGQIREFVVINELLFKAIVTISVALAAVSYIAKNININT